MKNFKGKLKQHFHEVIIIKKSPHSIALGFAIGTCIAILPTLGFSIILAILIVLICQKPPTENALHFPSLVNYFIIYKPSQMVHK